NDLPSIALVVKPYATRKPEAGIFIMEPGKLLPIEPAAPLFIFTKSTVATEVQPLPPDAAPEKEAVAATERVGSAVPTAPEAPAPRVPEPEPNREPKRDPVVTTAAAPPPRRQPPPREDLVAPELRFSAYPPAEPRPIRTILAALAFTLAAIALGGVLGYRYAGGNPRAAGAQAAERQQPGTVSAGLSASPQSDGVLLRWDLNSELVRTATRGILTITEAAGTKTVELSAAELKNGNVIYHHVGPSITFSLELHFGDRRRFTETISTAASGLGSLR
ncbi:MAG TPA: hypothetical protein VEQ63_08900, partial [Bryobacteraceae bacterium]|nr:hypothetical protein [Bryobacteraceae bacterium]